MEPVEERRVLCGVGWVVGHLDFLVDHFLEK